VAPRESTAVPVVVVSSRLDWRMLEPLLRWARLWRFVVDSPRYWTIASDVLSDLVKVEKRRGGLVKVWHFLVDETSEVERTTLSAFALAQPFRVPSSSDSSNPNHSCPSPSKFHLGSGGSLQYDSDDYTVHHRIHLELRYMSRDAWKKNVDRMPRPLTATLGTYVRISVVDHRYDAR
jgi:hypothetical protein